MRQAPTPIISPRRLARLNAWARLWLVWVVGWFAACWNADASPRALDWLAHRVRTLIVVNMAARYTPRPLSVHRHGRLKHVRVPAIVGAKIRRAMRGKDAPSRLFAILAIMRDMDALVARRLREIGKGLTRLRVIVPTCEGAPRIAAVRLAPASADTS
jgi:hypothetical protein